MVVVVPKGVAGLLLAAVAGLVALAVLSASVLGYGYSERTTNDLIAQLVATSTEGLRTHLQRYLDEALTVNGVNVDAVRLGTLDVEHLMTRPEDWFVSQHQRFLNVDDIYFGRKDGAIAGVDRVNGHLVLKLTTAFPVRSFFGLDAQGRRDSLLDSAAYDARQRDWFKAAVAAQGPIWSPAYVLLNRNELGITAARPAWDATGNLVGVMGANLTLKSISRYLVDHPVGPRSTAYIVDAGGGLIATSGRDTPLFLPTQGKPARVMASAASDPMVSASYQALLQARSTPWADGQARSLDIRVGDAPYRVYLTPFRDVQGLDWQIVSVVDPAIYLAGARYFARVTLLIGAVLLLVLALLVVLATRRMARPVLALRDATRQIAEGHPGQTVQDVGGGREMSELVASFNDMSQKLKTAQDAVQAHAAQLEADVAQRTHELVRANQALAQARDVAESASQAKTLFLANMSHEIRTPLNAMSGMCYLMRRDGLAPGQEQRMGVLEKASQHLLGVVSSVLDIAKIESGKFELDEGPVWIEALVANVVSMLSEQATSKHLVLRTELGALPQGLRGDRIRLQQMLLNYAANAIKFTEQGSVVVAVRALDEGPDHALIQFQVTDTGPGIAPDALTRLFAPFEQGDLDTARRHGGSGLGLSITRRLAELMGGNASAASQPGQGSQFQFTVRLKKGPAGPRSDEPLAHHQAEQAIRADFGGARVLVVEDEPVNLMITQALLSQVGLATDTAVNGSEAVQRASACRYDLILMDLLLPGVDGLEATRLIRRLPEHAHTPIIATTANAFSDDRQRCLLAGMNDFVSKPMDPREFFATLHWWLAHR